MSSSPFPTILICCLRVFIEILCNYFDHDYDRRYTASNVLSIPFFFFEAIGNWPFSVLQRIQLRIRLWPFRFLFGHYKNSVKIIGWCEARWRSAHTQIVVYKRLNLASVVMYLSKWEQEVATVILRCLFLSK